MKMNTSVFYITLLLITACKKPVAPKVSTPPAIELPNTFSSLRLITIEPREGASLTGGHLAESGFALAGDEPVTYIEIAMSEEGRKYDKDTKTVEYFDEARRTASMASIRDGKLFINNELAKGEEPWDLGSESANTKGAGDFTSKWTSYLFVMDGQGRIFSGREETEVIHHSSFVEGRPVAAAGKFWVDETGAVKMITNSSGHYRLPSISTDQLLHALWKQGVVLEDVYLGELDATSKGEDDLRYREFDAASLAKTAPLQKLLDAEVGKKLGTMSASQTLEDGRQLAKHGNGMIEVTYPADSHLTRELIFPNATKQQFFKSGVIKTVFPDQSVHEFLVRSGSQDALTLKKDGTLELALDEKTKLQSGADGRMTIFKENVEMFHVDKSGTMVKQIDNDLFLTLDPKGKSQYMSMGANKSLIPADSRRIPDNTPALKQAELFEIKKPVSGGVGVGGGGRLSACLDLKGLAKVACAAGGT